MLDEPPPRVIHVRVGNMKMREFHGFISQVWPQAAAMVESHKLVIVHTRTIDCIA